MLNIIKSDLFRILKGKAIYIALLIIIILTIISVVGMSAGHTGLSVGSDMNAENAELLQEISNAKSLGEYRRVMKTQGNFELDKQIVGQNVNLYYFFIAIVIIILCTDFSNKSIKNTLSSAISRKKYYLAKFTLVILLGTFIILFNNYLAYILNFIINGKNFASSLEDFTKLTFIQLPLLYGIISLLICILFLVRKTSVFNSIAIPIIMVIQLIGTTIINILKIKGDFFYNYEIQYALSNLASNPSNEYIVKCAILGILYIIIFNIIGYYSFKKVEIK